MKFYSVPWYQIFLQFFLPVILIFLVIKLLLLQFSIGSGGISSEYSYAIVGVLVLFSLPPVIIRAFRILASYSITEKALTVRELLFIKKTVIPFSDIKSFTEEEIFEGHQSISRIYLLFFDNSAKSLRFHEKESMKKMAFELGKYVKNETAKVTPITPEMEKQKLQASKSTPEESKARSEIIRHFFFAIVGYVVILIILALISEFYLPHNVSDRIGDFMGLPFFIIIGYFGYKLTKLNEKK